jgi:hypothetical protein
MKKMRCGNCGHSKHILFETKKKDIVAKCLKCNNKSKITVTLSKIDIEWVKNSKGLLTVF